MAGSSFEVKSSGLKPDFAHDLGVDRQRKMLDAISAGGVEQ
jgi:hypothetical protein